MSKTARRQISPQALAQLGAKKVVYIRPIVSEAGVTTFQTHAADGSPMGVSPSLEAAVARARYRELTPVTVH